MSDLALRGLERDEDRAAIGKIETIPTKASQAGEEGKFAHSAAAEDALIELLADDSDLSLAHYHRHTASQVMRLLDYGA